MHTMRRGESLCARAAARRSLLLLLLARAVAQDVDLTGDFFFGLGTAPGHAEDSLDDAWRQFAEDGHVQAWKSRGQPDERLQFWSRPEVELDLAAQTGIKVYRLGVDWGRLVPNCSMSAMLLLAAAIAVSAARRIRRAAPRAPRRRL